MPYIKISDPNIIDLAAWHQVINVVNQHSDSITAITNNFGAQGAGSINWGISNESIHEYDPGSQKIIFGRYKIDPGEASFNPSNKHMFYDTINMTDQSGAIVTFSEKPIITATVQSTNTADPVPFGNTSIACSIIRVENDSFVIRVVDTRSYATTGDGGPVKIITQPFYINWMAIGPK
jgi:hypothetical protein